MAFLRPEVPVTNEQVAKGGLMSQSRKVHNVRLWLAAILALGVAAAGMLARRYVVYPLEDATLSDDRARAYCVDPIRTLVMWPQDHGMLPVNVNWEVRRAVVPSNYGRQYGDVLLWHRDSLEGVPLDDRVKLESGNDGYHFSGDRAVTLIWRGRPLAVILEHAPPRQCRGFFDD